MLAPTRHQQEPQQPPETTMIVLCIVAVYMLLLFTMTFLEIEAKIDQSSVEGAARRFRGHTSTPSRESPSSLSPPEAALDCA